MLLGVAVPRAYFPVRRLTMACGGRRAVHHSSPSGFSARPAPAPRSLGVGCEPRPRPVLHPDIGSMDWFSLAAGKDCPFDLPRLEPNPFWDSVSRLSVSTLCLLKNQLYRGHSILIYDPKHVSRPDQLNAAEWASFSRDAHVAVKALVELFRPDHINVECLGNEVPHLHWHLVPRYTDDPRWGGPIWTTTREEMCSYELPEQERASRLLELRAAITHAQSANLNA